MRGIDLCTEETKTLVSYNPDRYDNEPETVKELRKDFARLIDGLVLKRNSLDRWEATRNLQIAITHLEDACMRAVKAEYTV